MFPDFSRALIKVHKQVLVRLAVQLEFHHEYTKAEHEAWAPGPTLHSAAPHFSFASIRTSSS